MIFETRTNVVAMTEDDRKLIREFIMTLKTSSRILTRAILIAGFAQVRANANQNRSDDSVTFGTEAGNELANIIIGQEFVP